ncbi:hypothetical protein SAMN04487970_102152 [Paenibacillus tianmuensis]|uniref:Uncharacterized protein n=1 Tax=Paenibacillus tianmuensis TaxID=624147 RepID=A0A1G4RZY8_9BACL|nr:hypothetical protein SAMN04487970_102152 [Paenibacillus tianmuensis]
MLWLNLACSCCSSVWFRRCWTPGGLLLRTDPSRDGLRGGTTLAPLRPLPKCSQRRSNSCSARTAKPNPLVDDRKQSLQAFNNHLTRLPCYGWLRAACNCFRRVLVCKLLTEKPKEGCDSLPPRNLSQPPNPRPRGLSVLTLPPSQSDSPRTRSNRSSFRGTASHCSAPLCSVRSHSGRP